jgi:hypothetical protein
MSEARRRIKEKTIRAEEDKAEEKKEEKKEKKEKDEQKGRPNGSQSANGSPKVPNDQSKSRTSNTEIEVQVARAQPTRL